MSVEEAEERLKLSQQGMKRLQIKLSNNKLFPKQSPREVSKSKREQPVTSSIACQVSRLWGDAQRKKKKNVDLI